MIAPSDIDYKETKLIKQGKRSLNKDFKELADWINSKYNLNVLNIYFDNIKPDNRSRLNIIFEFKNDALKFSKGEFGNFYKKDQEIIAYKFEELNSSKYKITNLFVIFTAFEPIAKIEANENVTKKEILNLKNKLNIKDLWEISNMFSGVTFFFYTDQQVKNYNTNEMKEILISEYYQILRKYDEFSYFTKNNIFFAIDSKENFDKNYHSNWFYYYRWVCYKTAEHFA